MITIYTMSDTEIESDEIIEIRVKINAGKPVYCSTRVRIIDDSKWLMYNLNDYHNFESNAFVYASRY